MEVLHVNAVLETVVLGPCTIVTYAQLGKVTVNSPQLVRRSTSRHHLSRASYVKEDVVEGGIVSDAIATANHRLILAQNALKDARSPRESNVGSKVIQILRNGGNLGDIRRERRIPEWNGKSLIRDGYIMQQIDRLLIPFPTQPQVEGQVVFD